MVLLLSCYCTATVFREMPCSRGRPTDSLSTVSKLTNFTILREQNVSDNVFRQLLIDDSISVAEINTAHT